MFMYLQKNKKGFTLIELMVVVAIIGILALLGLRVYTGQQEKAKNSIVKANAGTIQTLIQANLADSTFSEVAGMVDDTTATGLFTKAGIHVPDGGAQTENGDGTTEGHVYVDEATDGGDLDIFEINGTGFDGEDVYDTPLIARK
jgi:prepilin-type N-terminal cleavage/methylation domain-containing protein